MSSSGRKSTNSNKTTWAGSRPGSSSKRTPTTGNRPGSSSKTGAEPGVRNKSNSAANNERRQLPESDRRIAPNKVSNVAGKIKVLGQDAELTETEIWNMNGVSSGKSTPLSSRSSTFRTPTPSKQISLQAVRRKEERDEPLETIDWNDFVRPVSKDEDRSDSMLDDRIPTPELTDSDESDADSAMTMEDRLQLVEKRAQEMTSALSSHALNDMEENLSKQLEKVELEREEQDKIERQKQDNVVIGNKERQNNENFREFGPVSPRRLVTDSDIVGANSQTGGLSINPGASLDLDKGPSSDVNFTVGARPKQLKGDNESQKKNDAVEQKDDDTRSSSSGQKESTVEKEEESSSSDEENDEDDENDLIGRKGKAPNELLMEFLDCMMKEEYETAGKLCKMILIYEPNNQEALNFYPLIQMKIQQEEEEEEESDSESDSDDEDSDDEDDDEDNDDDNEDDSSEESDEDDSRVPDSGIVSAANSD